MQGLPDSSTIHGTIANVAAEDATRIAVVHGTEALTYGQLMERSAAVAQALAAHEVAGRLIGISLQRSVDMITGIVGILRAGAAYVPLDPQAPAARSAMIAEDARLAAIVVDDASYSITDVVACPRLLLGDLSSSGPRPEEVEVLPSDRAYVIFTSGSSGRPKGVVVEHAQVLDLFSAAGQVFDIGADDVWAQLHSFAFDFSVWEIFGALLHGGTALIVPPEVIRDPAAFWRLMDRQGVTMLSQTPSYFDRLAPESPAHCGSLRYIFFGGEALQFQRLRGWFDRHGDDGPQLINMYGITETTVHVTHRRVSRSDVETRGSLIGAPLPHLEIELVGADLSPVADGEAGEVIVSGSGVARGYLVDPAGSPRFLPPAGPLGRRRYRSGDLARRLPDGDLEYLGRLDDQVQVSGHRVELHEIQHHVDAHSAVARSWVLGIPDPDGNLLLVAYVVPSRADQAVLSSAETRMAARSRLRHELAQKLPSYMVPHHIVWVPELPVNINGKPDLSGLPSPWAEQAPAPTPNDVGGVDIQALVNDITRVWREVLKVPDLSDATHFFDAGGDSIRAIKVAAKARERGLSISAEDLLSNPTPASLAPRLASAGESDRAPRASAPFSLVRQADRGLLPPSLVDAYPVTALQLGMLVRYPWDSDELPIYHSVSYGIVELPLDAARLRAVLSATSDRHDVLRTKFDLVRYSVPLQLVEAEAEVDLVVETGTVGARDLDAVIEEAVRQERVRAFDPAVAPLVRYRAMAVSDECFVFVWTEHHAILDGWSSNSLFAEVVRDYAGSRQDGAVGALPFRDYVSAEQSKLDGPEAVGFWRTELAGLPASKPVSGDQASGQAQIIFGDDVWDRTSDAAQRLGCTPHELVEAVVAVAVGQAQGATEVVLGAVTNGRVDAAGGDLTLGLFLNLVPHRISLDGATWRDVVANVRAARQRVTAHRRFPASAIARSTGVRIDVAFNYTDFDQLATLAADGLIRSDRIGNYVETDVPFMIEADRRSHDGELELLLHWGSPSWDEVAGRAVDGLRRGLDAIAADVETLPASIGAAQAPTNASGNVLDAILAQVARRPTADAVADGSTAVSYAELLVRVQRCASTLRRNGVSSGDAVAVMMSRTVDLVAATLAVFWIGARLVPIEPDHPAKRRDAIIDDAGVVLALTSRAADLPVPHIVWRGDDDSAEAASHELKAPVPGGTGVAYVLYTSGSTGRPKGVEVSHAALSAMMAAIVERVGLRDDDVVLGWTSVMFDIVFVEHVAALFAGCRLELLSDDEVTDPVAVRDRCVTSGVTVVHTTPAKMELLVEVGWPGARLAICGGERFLPRLAGYFVDESIEAWNAYGPTEATVWATFHQVTADDRDDVPIGAPLAGAVVRVVDDAGRRVPEGQSGELWIGGAGVAAGYRNLPDLTREKFVDLDDDRWYRTGDLVTERDGNLYYHGRIDDQIKIKGVRIEIAEIETVLAALPDVERAAVLAVATARSTDLVAFVVPGRRPVSGAMLRAHAAESLVPAAVPGEWMFLQELPLTISGKIDRVSLRQGLQAGSDREAPEPSHHVPVATLDERVASAWETVLGQRPQSGADTFIELGGDSLGMMRLIGAYARQGFTVTSRELIESPTVAEQSDLLGSGGNDGAAPATPESQ